MSDATVIVAEGIDVGGTWSFGTFFGGGIGSVGGPPGAAIGAGIGLAVSCAVDWWMSAEFAEKMTQQLNGYFDDLEHKLVSGGKNWPGMKADLEQANRLQSQAQRRVIVDALSVRDGQSPAQDSTK